MNDDSQGVDPFDIGGKHKIRHLRVDNDGNATFKHLPTNELVKALQLGIQHSVGGLEAKPSRDILIQDFLNVEIIEFPKTGKTTSKPTPSHSFSDFTIRSYAPVAFRHFREKFNIKPEDYLSSLCRPFRELKNPGASGSLFYLTADDEFIIKTVQKKESIFLRRLLPGYYMNIIQNQRTLLPKFFGLYCYHVTEFLSRSRNGSGDNKNIRIVVMNNLIPSRIPMHEKYDLKGSTYKRRASSEERNKQCPTWKDIDFRERHPNGLILDSETFNALSKTVERDCRVLESFSIMDYSFLIGIHYANQRTDSPNNFPTSNGTSRDLKSPTPRMMYATPMANIHVEFEEHNRPDDAQLAKTGGIPAETADGQRVYLYVGIIDILQAYQLRKKLEHTFKSVLTDGSQISVTHPKFYSERFQDFLFNTVFKKAPSRQSVVSTGKSSITTTTPSMRSLYTVPYLIPSRLLSATSGSGSNTPISCSTTFSTSMYSSRQSDRHLTHGSSTTFYASSHQSDSLYNQPTQRLKAKIVTTRFNNDNQNQTDNQRIKFDRDRSNPPINGNSQHSLTTLSSRYNRNKHISSTTNITPSNNLSDNSSKYNHQSSEEIECIRL